MDRQQNERQLASLLRLATWRGGGSKILGSVVVSARPLEAFARDLTWPCALVRAIAEDRDRQLPQRANVARFEIVLAAQAAGDLSGEGALVGANRSSTTTSDGRGVDELVDEIIYALGISGRPGVLTDSQHGMLACIEGVSVARELPEIAAAAVTLSVAVYNQGPRFYHPVTRASATGAVGSASLAWSLPPARFDRLRVIVRRSGAGGSAPASPSSGTGVTVTGGDLGVAATASGLAPGTYAFSIFVAYDETNETPTDEQRYSDAVTLTGVVVS